VTAVTWLATGYATLLRMTVADAVVGVRTGEVLNVSGPVALSLLVIRRDTG
jgi:hypothetical protein